MKTLKDFLYDEQVLNDVSNHLYNYDELKIFGIISIHDETRKLLDIEDMCWLTIKIYQLWDLVYNVQRKICKPNELFEMEDVLLFQSKGEEGYSQIYAERICDYIIQTYIMEA